MAIRHSTFLVHETDKTYYLTFQTIDETQEGSINYKRKYNISIVLAKQYKQPPPPVLLESFIDQINAEEFYKTAVKDLLIYGPEWLIETHKDSLK